MGDSTSWNPQGLSRPVQGLLYLYLYLLLKKELIYLKLNTVISTFNSLISIYFFMRYVRDVMNFVNKRFVKHEYSANFKRRTERGIRIPRNNGEWNRLKALGYFCVFSDLTKSH